jgi:hypothetical protein
VRFRYARLGRPLQTGVFVETRARRNLRAWRR